MYRVYISISGSGFDPMKFHAEYGNELGGEIGIRKVLQDDGSVDVRPATWKKERMASDIEDAPCQLKGVILSVKSSILALKNCPEVQFTLGIVQEIRDEQQAAGIFLPEDLIQLLAEIGAGFDFDISRAFDH